ncbi:MAG: putative transport system permease protein [Clostridia bacterium]|nr:putative transport system permease protein [Clostridia bacterium]
MNLYQIIRLAAAGIMGNKLRSFLTMLGVIIGVGSVIILTAMGGGTTKQVTQRIQQMGSNMITVIIRGRGADTGLTLAEALAFKEIPGVSGVAPVVSGNVKAKAGTRNYDTAVEGTTEDYLAVRNFNLNAGRFLSSLDRQYRQQVAVLGSEVVNQLFPFTNPVGQQVQVNGLNFTVVGVLAPKGGSEDDRIIIPITTAQRLLRNTRLRNIYLQAASPDQVNGVIARLEPLLSRRFKGDTDAYRIFNQTAMLETVSQVSSTLSLMLGGIAGISLLVGGIGIMNIMLVSVTERTREIGIRKAIGARRRDILGQFLIEAMVLSGMGGIIGIISGIAGAFILQKLAGISIALSPAVIVIAWGFALLVGVFFGFYPANRAAALQPIEALRAE